MPLSNNVLVILSELTTRIHDKTNLSETDIELIKKIFNRILESGDRYDVDEIEAWFENEGSWTHKPTVIRITNMSHYVLSRFQQSPKKFKMIPDNDGCCH